MINWKLFNQKPTNQDTILDLEILWRISRVNSIQWIVSVPWWEAWQASGGRSHPAQGMEATGTISVREENATVLTGKEFE